MSIFSKLISAIFRLPTTSPDEDTVTVYAVVDHDDYLPFQSDTSEVAEPAPAYGDVAETVESKEYKADDEFQMPSAVYEREEDYARQPSWCMWRNSHLCNRAKTHNYTREGAYVVSLVKAPDADPLSVIGRIKDGDVSRIAYRLTELGVRTQEAIMSVGQRFQNAMIVTYNIMPDHIHLLIYLKPYSYTHLDDVVAHIRTQSQQLSGRSTDLFLAEYNDRILRRPAQVQNAVKYIDDNMRRARIKAEHPEYYNHVLRMAIQTDEGVERFLIYGNPWLLHEPLKVPVRISSKYGAEYYSQLEMEWEDTVRAGGVLVSPFIGPEERVFMQTSLDANARIIHLVNYGLHPNYQPPTHRQPYFTQHNILIVAPDIHWSEKRTLTRDAAMHLNDLAALISETPIGKIKLRRL